MRGGPLRHLGLDIVIEDVVVLCNMTFPVSQVVVIVVSCAGGEWGESCGGRRGLEAAKHVDLVLVCGSVYKNMAEFQPKQKFL